MDGQVVELRSTDRRSGRPHINQWSHISNRVAHRDHWCLIIFGLSNPDFLRGAWIPEFEKAVDDGAHYDRDDAADGGDELSSEQGDDRHQDGRGHDVEHSYGTARNNESAGQIRPGAAQFPGRAVFARALARRQA